MKKQVSSLLLKVILLFAPFLVLLLLYCILDPFKVIYKYSPSKYLNTSDGFDILNRDIVSSNIFIDQRKKENYDSYIFGNSRSLAFLCEDWQKYSGCKHPFHFDAAGESLFGIYTKIKYINSVKQPFKNILLVLDYSILGETKLREEHSRINHPSIAKIPLVTFHFSFIRAFFSEFFFIKYLDYNFTGIRRSYMDDMFAHSKRYNNEITNDLLSTELDDQIKSDSLGYYKSKASVFYFRNKKEVPSLITFKQMELLKKISSVFQNSNTVFKIVISPLYDQNKFNKDDLLKLCEIFGKSNVYDYSGKNKYTSNIGNYYESSHFRPLVARDILRDIYSIE